MPPPLLRALLRGPKDLLTGPNASILNSAMQGTKPLAHGPMGKFNIKAAAAPLPLLSVPLLFASF